MTLPKILGYIGKALFSYHSTTNTLQTVGPFRERKFGQVSDKQMDRVILAIELNHLGLKIKVYGFKYWSHELKHFFSEYATTVFSDKDPMYLQIINTSFPFHECFP
jgi:hypothetical protein